jgi:3-deoxy-manno-octulosonate cytidylyltransferase (CMP-KDO synthetase)
MNNIIVIPARFASSRFPGKPLALINEKTLIQRVFEIAQAVKSIDGVFVATDSEEIAQHVKLFSDSSSVVMTSESCTNGTERVWEAVRKLDIKPRCIINLQGDAALMPPWVIEALVLEMQSNKTLEIVTPAARLNKDQAQAMRDMKARGIVSGTTVTFSRSKNALYFSKNIIPFIRADSKLASSEPPIYQHIGVYGYSYSSLKRYIELPVGDLERCEQLEQLRALENDMPIRVVEVSLQGRTIWPVDNREDIARVTDIIANEGELV